MDCDICLGMGKRVQHDLLYNCQTCGIKACTDHINNHQHSQGGYGTQQYPRFQAAPDLRRWSASLSQLGMLNYKPNYREPTPEEYEMFLRSNPRVLTSGKESIDLFIGVLLIAFVFGFRPLIDGLRTWQFILMLVAIIAPAFILHELGHKYAAIHYGKYARFTLIRNMAYLTLLFGFLGFGIAGPGATMIIGRSNKRETGIFAAAGPAINFSLALISLGLTIILPNHEIASLGHDLHWVFFFAIFINCFLALFNLLPIAILDGKKIITWNSGVWGLLVGINLTLLFYAYPLIFPI